ncbi:MAG: class I SAM-dependent methyltransferase [Anaerolineaceae bacterium]
MPIDRSARLFNRLSPAYERAFDRQRKQYTRIFQDMPYCNVSNFSSIVDVGCGNGAMASVFSEMGLKTFALDLSIGMLSVAKRRIENQNVYFTLGNAAGELPFPDKSFDIVMASFMAHGMDEDQRKKLYTEMQRVGKHLAILHDYNGAESILMKLAEVLEGGNYFQFIRQVKNELMEHYGNLEIMNTDKDSCCYISSID